ncbi:MAG: CDP-alcohol phosphatidyltransferase [Hyphomicrobiales bacterium]|nr:MAG: CDP-alcohol phosphatidyltransferase [Hyphomicrobiales bacterium]
MATQTSKPQEIQQNSILSYIWDIPNLCSLAGLGCSLLAIYFAIIGIYPAAMIGMIWAVAFDWADGLIARRMKGRTGTDSTFGGQLDLLIDIVSYGITPAILVLSYGNFAAAFLPVAFFMLVTGVIRLSYFSTFGLDGSANYTGLAIDNNCIFLVFVFLFAPLFDQFVFSIILAIAAIILSSLNVSQIKTPKLSGKKLNVQILAAYTIGISAVYGWMLF